MPHLVAARDVGALVAAATIQSVTSAAGGVESPRAGYGGFLEIVIRIILLRKRGGSVKGGSPQ
jgi:hypothetical protein